MLDDAAMKQCALGYSVIVPWGELTSSKLLAQSYEKAGKRARLPTTDYRPLNHEKSPRCCSGFLYFQIIYLLPVPLRIR